LLSPNVVYKDSTFRNTNLACLASNIYNEARGEIKLGQLAVAKVTINRTINGNYCDTVFKPYQFSWTIKNKNLKYDSNSYTIALEAEKVNHSLSDFSATHYHTTKVRPVWAKSFKRLTIIGNHVFYEERQIQKRHQ
jgi:spore germination cell wall hydrolase CwlJ-like protein